MTEALTFRTGTNEWVQHDTWPPRRDVADRKLYLQADRKLSFDPPPASADRRRSTATWRIRRTRCRIARGRSGLNTGWTTWLVEDQRFVHRRPDVLDWVSEPLASDLTVSGKIVANLFASTSGTDSDWIVKLIDVYPEKYAADPEMGGYQLMIAGDVFRARYRHSFEKPEPLKPGAVEHYQIEFPANDHVFRAGHRIMVQVQSSLVPGDRSQPADVRAEHLPRASVRLSAGNSAGLPLRPAGVVHRASRKRGCWAKACPEVGRRFYLGSNLLVRTSGSVDANLVRIGMRWRFTVTNVHRV